MNRALLIALLTVPAVFAQSTPAQKKTTAPDQKQAQAKEATTPQTDYVCGMTVDPKTAEAKYAYKGKMYYFCSRDDQQEFAKAPEKYMPKK